MKNQNSITFLLFLLALLQAGCLDFHLTQPCWAQQSEAQPPITPTERFTNKWALVIGVGSFAEPTWNLKYATKDANDFKKYLVDDANFDDKNIELLTAENASKTTIEESIDKFAGRVGKNDLMLIYIRTRGTLPHFTKDGEPYLAMPTTGLNNIEQTAIKMTDFSESIIKKIHPKTIAIIEDADYAKLNNGGGAGIGPLIDLSKSASLAFVGCGPLSWESKTYQNSIFTRHLIDALKSGGKTLDLFHVCDGFNDAMGNEVEAIRHDRYETAGASGFGHEGAPMRIYIAAPALKH
jgi:hypothetical protein